MAPRKKSTPAKPSSHAAGSPQHEEIASLAYEFFVQRGCVDGLDLDDWLQAERELLAKDSMQLPAAPKPGRRRKAAGAAAAH
jgi:hypothetical protein